MIGKSKGKNYSQAVNILIFIFPIVIISLQVAGDVVLFILAMMGLFVAISQKLSPFTIKEIKLFSYITFGYFIAVCLSVFFYRSRINGQSESDLRRRVALKTTLSQ